MWNINSEIKFKLSMINSSLSDLSGAYILINGTVAITRNRGEKQTKETKK